MLRWTSACGAATSGPRCGTPLSRLVRPSCCWYASVTIEEQRRRNARRLSTEPEATWPMSDDELKAWAEQFDVPTPGELDGSEPIAPPPAGFASWSEWMERRWPARVARSEPAT